MPAVLPFDHRIDRAAHLSVLARRFFDVYWHYEGADTRPAILPAMNVCPEFFRFDSHAHFVSLVIHVAALFERRNDTINFSALVDEAAQGDLVPAALLDAARGHLDASDQSIRGVIVLRSNLFAHRSASLGYSEAFRVANITPFQLRDLTDTGLTIANLLLRARGLPEHMFSPTTLSDTKKLLSVLGSAGRAAN